MDHDQKPPSSRDATSVDVSLANDPEFFRLIRRIASPDETPSPSRRTPHTPLLAPGTMINGKYRIDWPLASGGIGVVYRAEDVKLARPVALKMLLPNVVRDARVLARFDLEARAAAQITSDHVAKILDVGELPDGEKFIVMELLIGKDFAELLSERHHLPVVEAVELILQACEALAEAHSCGIVHRDLKLSNLFLAERADGSTTVKLIDFGLVKTTVFASQDRAFVAPEASQSHGIVGTPRSMAPEQIAGRGDIGPAADIWALGTVLYELLSGSPPFAAATVPELFAAILERAPTSLMLRESSIPKPLALVVHRCLEKEPANRPRDIGELALALAPFAPAHARQSAERAARVLRFCAQSDATRPRVPSDVGSVSNASYSPAVVVPSRGRLRCKPRLLVAGAVLLAVAAALPFMGIARDRSLRVAFLYVGDTEDAGWTAAHDRAREALSSKLAYLKTEAEEHLHEMAHAKKAIDEFATDGVDVIVATSRSFRQVVLEKAQQHKRVKFILYGDVPAQSKVASFGAPLDSAWYLAGIAAALTSSKDRLGFVASKPAPEVVRWVNAFTRGARSVKKEIAVEVRWCDLSAEHALHAEVQLTEELLATGCDVIANGTDNALVRDTARSRNARFIGHNDPAQCSDASGLCLGVVAPNWEPAYRKMFEAVHRRDPAWHAHQEFGMSSMPNEGVVDFKQENAALPVRVQEHLQKTRETLVNARDTRELNRVIYCSEQSPSACQRPEQSPSEGELRSMCWFVAGVVVKADPKNPGSGDQPAQVPAACGKFAD
jgi:serine/threonine protein kinase/basic membrane lipoprotein Med (substrate-binding protein (PBP1-ABC) superfamily)